MGGRWDHFILMGEGVSNGLVSVLALMYRNSVREEYNLSLCKFSVTLFRAKISCELKANTNNCTHIH